MHLGEIFQRPKRRLHGRLSVMFKSSIVGVNISKLVADEFEGSRMYSRKLGSILYNQISKSKSSKEVARNLSHLLKVGYVQPVKVPALAR